MVGINYDVTEKEMHYFKIQNAIIKTEEAERQRISHDLHDGLGQTIAAANMFMNTMESMAEEYFDNRSMKIFITGKELIQKAARETRLVSHNIMPRSLKQFGLEKTISQLLNNYETINKDLSISFNSNLNNNRFNGEKELTLFRAIQESVNNAIKHSGSNKIKCNLKKVEDTLNIEVNDYGIGFDIDKIKKDNTGIGLVSLSQRVKMIGGKLEINSVLGKGTTVKIVVNLKDNEAL